ncbi:hypothetical protein H0A73_20810 [Alcaligenaceae bacterium]|nr:hypothetical protein [Alcaligenaceae bacterium]
MKMNLKKLAHLSDLLGGLRPGEPVTIHSAAANPTRLARQLAESAPMLGGRCVYALMPYGPVPYADAPARDSLKIATALPGPGLRAAMEAGRVVALRRPLSAMPALFPAGERAGMVLLRVAPPDASGRCNLGVAVDYMPAALRAARFVVAEIDPGMPVVPGEGWVDVGRIDACIQSEDGPHQMTPPDADTVDIDIARHVVSLLKDGDVLQTGVGALPEQVLRQAAHLKSLGLHTGILTDGARALMEAGVIDNSRKGYLPGVSVATMALGTAGLYAFMDRNPSVFLASCAVTHAGEVLRQVQSLKAINGALQVDLQGRVNAEWAGARQVSLPGGLPDFARAAAAQEHGLSIIALRSCDRHGRSAIVPALAPQHPCSLDAHEVDCYVTEYGIAHVRGRSEAARRGALIAIAHPGHREMLERACR